MHVQVTYNCIIMVNWCEPKLRSNVKKNFFPHSFQKDFHIIIWHLILQKVTNKHSYWKTGTEHEVFSRASMSILWSFCSGPCDCHFENFCKNQTIRLPLIYVKLHYALEKTVFWKTNIHNIIIHPWFSIIKRRE